MTKLELYESKKKNICEYGLSKECSMTKSNKLLRELESLAIEINKENNCYYDNETWITKFTLSNENLTGNELTDCIANEFNKMNGVVLERNVENGKVNYFVSVITPYYIYHYTLYRGYNNIVKLEPSKNFINGSNKSYTRKIVPVKHIAELIYSESCNFDIEKTNILKK